MKTTEIILLLFAAVIAISMLVVLFRGMRKSEKPDFLEEADGSKSSGRLWGHLILAAFFMFNFMFFSMLSATPEMLKGNLELLYFMLIFDTLLLIAVYMPKYLVKVKEMVMDFKNIKPPDNGNEKTE